MNTEVTKVEEKKLPTLSELYHDLYDVAKDTAFLCLVNNNPPSSFVLKHPISGKFYIPIEKIEFLLTKIFGNWSVEIKSHTLIANSVSVTIRLHYTNPTNGKSCFQDGIGAVALQTDKGFGATDFNAIKSNAVQLALPSAESFAIKDAAEKIGKIFGKDINRDQYTDYISSLDKQMVSIREQIDKQINKDLDG